MSYPYEIDEWTEDSLITELKRRSEARFNGTCDYCGRSPDKEPCRFPARHYDKRIIPTVSKPEHSVRPGGRI